MTVTYDYLLLMLLFATTNTNELTRCCSGGARHFRQMSKCSQIRTEGSGVACTRSASICCLRALLDQSCDHGTLMAKSFGYCSNNLKTIGGGVQKECCDCCLLGRDLIRQQKECIAPAGFSAACLRSFKHCCVPTTAQNPTERTPHSRPESMDIRQVEDRCATAKCAHFCNVRGDDHYECSCQTGYDLAPDGISCIDIDECSLTAQIVKTACKENELCENLEGGYRCYKPDQSIFMQGNVLDRSGYPAEKPSQNEDDKLPSLKTSTEKQTTFGEDGNSKWELYDYSLCPHGWVLSESKTCVDVDECLLLVDDCLEGQLCLNTPGSFRCIRTLSCGTGYALSSDTEQCIDVDECNLGSHDCGPLYQCRNTQGSYRCDPKTCPEGQIINPQTGKCSALDCLIGYKPSENGCVDVNECEIPGRCRQFEECINTPGSYRCQERGNLCTTGYQMDRNTGFCVDVDECANGLHTCENNLCINLIGTYKCRCPAGFDFNETTMHCEDIDECIKFGGHVCSLQATCENTFGSFKCHCNPGFRLADDGRNCEDIDECELGIAKCAQRCVNIPGSYQCICERGYQLGADGVTCEDTDECAQWAGIDDLCIGECINTPGSFRCTCPSGYELQLDGRTCSDIDECQRGECQGHERICVNTFGGFKCHYIECPEKFVHDNNYKNRCNRGRNFCETLSESACKDIPLHISWQYMAIPRLMPLSHHRTSITLFTIRGPINPMTTAQFELSLIRSIPEHAGVIPAVRSNFLLQKGEQINSAIIAIRDSLDGPQEVQLELVLRLNVNDYFHGKFIANLIIYVASYKRQRSIPI